ncbi:MAG: hypothetical protein HY741_16340 [Chloroflexi bacterium]|nr:hypothetical protein [Chloroflexota bacterium]
MNKLVIGASVAAFLLLLFASAFAFSTSLSTLHISAGSFAKPAAPVIAAPMTFTDESEITAPQTAAVHFQVLQNSGRVCERDKAHDHTLGF